MTKPFFIVHSFKYQEFKPHFHEHYSIGLITNGEQKLHLKNNRKLIKKGELRVINPYELHFVDSSSEWSYANIIIAKDDVFEIANEIYGLKRGFISFENQINTAQTIKSFLSLFNSLKDSLEFEENYIEFIEILLKKHSKFGDEKIKSNVNIAKVINYIKTNFFENIKLEELAKIAGVSKYHFIKQFKAKTNLTPHQYIMRVRIDYAIKLIKNSKNLSEVAFECGFSDQSHFIKEFKAIYGFTPSLFKK